MSKLLLARRKANDQSPDTFELLGKMLRSNPDFYTLWNYRKEILISTCSNSNIPLTTAIEHKGDYQYAVPLSQGSSLLEVELSLTAECIKKNPKSYGAWHHRLWMITHFEHSTIKELELCSLFLSSDQRNFHCWSYRRQIVTLAGAATTPHSEYLYSTQKINENFSNYSAFHHRSVYIKLLPSSSAAYRALLQTELAVVENAIYTEPDDQSAWWYRQFLLAWVVGGYDGSESSGEVPEESHGAWAARVLVEQVAVLEGLVEVEDDCKWALDALVQTRRLLASIGAEEGIESTGMGETELLQRLAEVDPSHSERYLG